MKTGFQNLSPAIEPIRWDSGTLYLLDQRELPQREVWLEIRTLPPFLDAVKSLAVRGAPLLGIAAGYGVAVGMFSSDAKTESELRGTFKTVREQIAGTRPTARNLFDSLERMERVVEKFASQGREKLLYELLGEAKEIHRAEVDNCLAIAEHGAPLFSNTKRIITHCNTGVLATGGIGTAFGVIHAVHFLFGLENVWVDETRPLLQGARLTAWELGKLGIPHRIVCDSTCASLISRGLVDCAITGADRIAANGDTANKIGTFTLAVACKHFGIPFYIAAPTSTFDLTKKSGAEIPIENRDEREVKGFRDYIWAPENSRAENPAFDVTPAELITAIITEKGVIEKPGAKPIVF
jgi:methylthioribose-1-phosphate isomerase